MEGVFTIDRGRELRTRFPGVRAIHAIDRNRLRAPRVDVADRARGYIGEVAGAILGERDADGGAAGTGTAA